MPITAGVLAGYVTIFSKQKKGKSWPLLLPHRMSQRAAPPPLVVAPLRRCRTATLSAVADLSLPYCPPLRRSPDAAATPLTCCRR